MSWGTPCLAMRLPKKRSHSSNKPHRAHFGGSDKWRQCYIYKVNLPYQYLAAPYLMSQLCLCLVRNSDPAEFPHPQHCPTGLGMAVEPWAATCFTDSLRRAEGVGCAQAPAGSCRRWTRDRSTRLQRHMPEFQTGVGVGAKHKPPWLKEQKTFMEYGPIKYGAENRFFTK